MNRGQQARCPFSDVASGRRASLQTPVSPSVLAVDTLGHSSDVTVFSTVAHL